MGGSSTQTTKSTSQATPYGPAQGTIDNILGQLNTQANNAGLNATENSALDTLTKNAQDGNPYVGQISNLATGLLNGGGAQANDSAIKSNLTDYQGLLTPYANGSMIGSNSALQAQLDQISRDVASRVNSQFAAAGRDSSGMNQQTLARGIAEGTAPVIAAQYNTDVDRALGAANSLYGAGNTTYGMLNQTQQAANGNAVQGIDVGSAALQAKDSPANQLLNIEQLRRSIPTSNLTGLLGSVAPVAQAFGTTNATSTTTSQQPLLNQLLGAAIGGVGLLSGTGAFGGSGWLYGTGKGASGLLNA